jgi:hypothetical protein
MFIVAAASSVLLFSAMTATGVIDFITLLNVNDNTNRQFYDLNNPVTDWITYNTDPERVFLTPPEMHHAALLAGRKIFMGQKYIVSCAGYDEESRVSIAYRIYSARDPYRLYQLVRQNGIGYVYIGNLARDFSNRTLNESLFNLVFQKVYENNFGEVLIYKTVDLPEYLVERLRLASTDRRIDLNFADEVVIPPLRNGNTAYLFDGNPNSVAVSNDISPAVVRLTFKEPVLAAGAGVLVGQPGVDADHDDWWLETADTEADLSSRTGTYREAVALRIDKGGKMDVVSLAAPVKAKIWQYSIRRTSGDQFVHIYEIELHSP